MQLNEELEANLTLNWIERTADRWDDRLERMEVIGVNISITFYNCHYRVFLKAEDIESETPIILMEGEAKLFDSLEDLLEAKYWQKLKAVYRKYLVYYDDKYNTEVLNG